MKKRASTIIVAILFLAGLSLLMYPFVANQWNSYRQSKLISNYQNDLAGLEAKGEVDYEAEMEKAKKYNQDLLPSILPDAFANAEGDEGESYFACLNVTGNGMMGTVEIPKIDVNLPIFHTTEEEVLQTAAGHLPGSSLPVGGENTHAVISAHRGLPSASLFTDLDKVEEGDHFLLHILNETLCYEVDQIAVVEPDDTTKLAVEKGEDLVTLLTCTPYGVNSHRLLVRGHRVPYEEGMADGEKSSLSLHTNYLLWVLIGLAVTGIFIFVLYRNEKKKQAKGKRPKRRNGSGSGKRRPSGKRPPARKPSGEGGKQPSVKKPSGEGGKQPSAKKPSGEGGKQPSVKKSSGEGGKQAPAKKVSGGSAKQSSGDNEESPVRKASGTGKKPDGKPGSSPNGSDKPVTEDAGKKKTVTDGRAGRKAAGLRMPPPGGQQNQGSSTEEQG